MPVIDLIKTNFLEKEINGKYDDPNVNFLMNYLKNYKGPKTFMDDFSDEESNVDEDIGFDHTYFKPNENFDPCAFQLK